MIQTAINPNTSNEALMNETEFIGIYEGNQNKIEYAGNNEECISLDSYTLDDSAVVGGVVWKPVVGFEEYYEVSDYGAVRSIRKGAYYNKIMKPYLAGEGYLYLHVKIGNKSPHIIIHRAVAEAFIPNPENKKYVDHINAVRTDNRVENLRWSTCSENALNPITRKRNSNSSKKSAIKLSIHVVNEETGMWFNSMLDAAKYFNMYCSSVISSCVHHQKGLPRRKSCRGKKVYHFRYATEEENAINLPKYIEYVNELVKT